MTAGSQSFATKSGVTKGRLPNFLIIGAKRSGTTSLARYLGSHPEVFMAPSKEVHYFDLNRGRGLDWYRDQFAGAGALPAVGEATQTYMYDPDIPQRLAQVMPAARLVAVLRNPADRAYSDYWFRRTRGLETLSFEDALAAEPERLESSFEERLACSYVDRGRYAAQLERVCEHFPREQIHILLFEEMRDRPRQAFSELCRFLGVDPRPAPENLGQKINPYVEYRSLRLRRMSLSLPSMAGKLVGRLNARASGYPSMNPETRRRLNGSLAADNARLARWMGRDLEAWDE